MHWNTSFLLAVGPQMIVFQCVLFMWKPGTTYAYFSRNSMALSGLHLTLNRSGFDSMPARRKILPPALNTRVSLSNGKLSSTPFFARQYSLISSIFMAPDFIVHSKYP